MLKIISQLKMLSQLKSIYLSIKSICLLIKNIYLLISINVNLNNHSVAIKTQDCTKFNPKLLASFKVSSV